MIEILLRHGADPLALDEDGRTAYQAAIETGHDEAARLLSERGGAQPVALNPETTLFVAIDGGDIQTAEKIIQKLEDLDLRDTRRQAFGMPLLSAAVFNGRPFLVEKLIEAGSNVNLRDREERMKMHDFGMPEHDYLKRFRDLGLTPLMYAAIANETRSCRLLTMAGADPDLLSWTGHSALMIAAGYGHMEILSILLKAGAKIDRRGVGQATALHEALEAGQTKAAILLLEAGANPTLKMSNGHDARGHSAVRRGRHASQLQEALDTALTWKGSKRRWKD